MTLNEFIEDALEKEQGFLTEALDGLSPQELTWRAGPDANSINWTLWHMLRVEDMWFQFFIQRKNEIWERDGWNERFGLPTRDNGFGHTSEQVADFPALDLAELTAYGQAVRQETLDYLRGSDCGGVRPGAPGATAGDVGGRHLPPNHRRSLPAHRPNRLPEGTDARRRRLNRRCPTLHAAHTGRRPLTLWGRRPSRPQNGVCLVSASAVGILVPLL